MDDRVNKILIVDDEKDVLDAMNLTLRRAKQFKSEISIASDGKVALTELQKQEFDLVLSDYKMPEMTGVELLAKVKDKYPKTVRVLITGYSDVKVAKEAINKSEVYNYIEKPWDNEELRLTIYEALKRKSERESEKITNVDNVKEALRRVNEFQDNLYTVPAESIPKQTMMFEFNSVSEFNTFSFEIKK